MNLILNAIDASKPGGKISVTALPADEPHYIAIKVIDYGTGIPKHILGSIFDPFFTTKTQGKGTGLGLSMSQGIITKHGGQIRVFSQEGNGTTFTVTLPGHHLSRQNRRRNRRIAFVLNQVLFQNSAYKKWNDSESLRFAGVKDRQCVD